jgi:hypothetical protein
MQPSARISSIKAQLPLRRSEDIETYATGLRLAGVPE